MLQTESVVSHIRAMMPAGAGALLALLAVNRLLVLLRGRRAAARFRRTALLLCALALAAALGGRAMDVISAGAGQAFGAFAGDAGTASGGRNVQPAAAGQGALPNWLSDLQGGGQPPAADDWFAGLTLQEGGFSGALEARSALLVDLTGGTILCQKATADPLAPASTAKLLTALTAWDLCSPDELVTAGGELAYVAADASRAGLAEGDVMTLRQLTCAMLLPSGNDAAYVIAAYAGRKLAGEAAGTQTALDAFYTAMNGKACELGARSSRFCTPDGYDAEGQQTTVQDLARIAHAFLQNGELAAIAGTPAVTLDLPGGGQRAYTNTNLLLDPASPWYDPCVTGLKTGRTGAAGCCLISTAQAGGTQYLCIVMGSGEEGRWADTLALLGSVGA